MGWGGAKRDKEEEGVYSIVFGEVVVRGRKVGSRVMDQDATIWKERGNAAFSEGRYDEAIAHYTSAVELDPVNAALFSNR